MTDELRDDGLTDALARSVDALRQESPVPAAWRAALLSRIEADRYEPPLAWTMRPAFAIAAGLALLIGGVAIGRFALAPSSNAPSVAIQASAASVRFVYVSPGAATVSVVGDFNQWNPSVMPLRRLTDGTWIADVPLTPGRYAYAFRVDGRIMVDPAAPRAGGEFGENSILMVRGS